METEYLPDLVPTNGGPSLGSLAGVVVRVHPDAGAVGTATRSGACRLRARLTAAYRVSGFDWLCWRSRRLRSAGSLTTADLLATRRHIIRRRNSRSHRRPGHHDCEVIATALRLHWLRSADCLARSRLFRIARCHRWPRLRSQRRSCRTTP